MLVRAYIRVSTDEQAEEGFSLPTQRERIRDFCRSQWGNAADLHWYEDEGFSAKNTDRPRLAALRQDCRPGDTVVVLRLDRLTRSVLDLYTLLTEWDKAGIYFRSVTEPYDTLKPEGRFMIGLLALLAEWERLRISERVREVMAHTVRADGRHLSKPPLGYDLADGSLAVNAAEAAQVAEIFRLYSQGAGARAIAAELDRRGLRTKQGARWSDFAVSYVLRNPIYTGKVSWQRIVARGKRRAGRQSDPEAIVVAGTHPPIVSEELWNAVQALRSGRSRVAPRAAPGAHPLTGLARCGLCGGPVHGVVQRRYQNGRPLAGRERRYYRCRRREEHKDCRLPYLPAPALERRVLEAVSAAVDSALLCEVAAALTEADGGARRAAALQAELRKCERALSRWDSAYAEGALTLAEWQMRTAEGRSRRDALVISLQAQETSPAAAPGAVAAAMADLPAVWAQLSGAERRTLLTGLLTQVTVQPDGSVTLTWRGLVTAITGHPLIE